MGKVVNQASPKNIKPSRGSNCFLNQLDHASLDVLEINKAVQGTFWEWDNFWVDDQELHVIDAIV